MPIGIVDLARLARNTSLDALQATRPGLRNGMEMEGLDRGLVSRLRTVAHQRALINRGIEDGTIHGADQFAADLARATESLHSAHAAIADPAVSTGRGWQARIPYYGRAFDASAAADALARAGDDLARAASSAHDDAISGVRFITRETSPVVARDVDVALPRTLDASTQAAMDAVDPAWLDFSPKLQRNVMRTFNATLGRAVGTRFAGLEHVRTGQAIYTSTHPSFLDPTALLQGIHRAGGGPVRAMAAAPVARLLGNAGRTTGVFPTRTKEFSGLDGARRMLDSGQSVAIFPEGGVLALSGGSSGEARSGITVLASEFDVPIVPSAGYGHQGRRVAGGTNSSRPVLQFGEPIRFRPVPEGATEAETAAHLAEIGEVYAQAHDDLLQQAVARYRAQ